MATEFVTIEVCVLVDAAGDSAIGRDEAEAREAYEGQVQALADCDGFRLVKVKVRVPLPEVCELEADALAPALADATADAK